jgi:glycosyltransferase involved in cell wall biosynthesis
MKILMVTNTYAPYVSGVARSVTTFAEEYRRRGHRVVVVAPDFDGAPATETDVIRVRALKQFHGSGFSVALGQSIRLRRAVAAFDPDIVHSHHPFLLGITASRLARGHGIPLVFTHHTFYEFYTHYLPGDSAMMKRLAIGRATRYANLCDAVFAPSKSVVDVLRHRGVTVPIFEVPTGVPLSDFAAGDGAGFRRRLAIPADATVVGSVGRLAEEKNLEFLARAVAAGLERTPGAYALLVGDGPSRQDMRAAFDAAGVSERTRFTGTLAGADLVDAYHAMDVFAFASLTETQGLVLTEAMAAGVPVVALDAPGAREIVVDGINGRLLAGAAGETEFADAIAWVAARRGDEAEKLRHAARLAAIPFAIATIADSALTAYESTIAAGARSRLAGGVVRRTTNRILGADWRRVSAVVGGGARPWR